MEGQGKPNENDKRSQIQANMNYEYTEPFRSEFETLLKTGKPLDKKKFYIGRATKRKESKLKF